MPAERVAMRKIREILAQPAHRSRREGRCDGKREK